MTAEIRVTRARSTGGMYRKYPVEIDGQSLGKIAMGTTMCVPVSAGPHVIRIGGRPRDGLGFRLAEGDFVEIEARGRNSEGTGQMRPMVSIVREGPIRRRQQ